VYTANESAPRFGIEPVAVLVAPMPLTQVDDVSSGKLQVSGMYCTPSFW
jgi:hypothetical protein